MLSWCARGYRPPGFVFLNTPENQKNRDLFLSEDAGDRFRLTRPSKIQQLKKRGDAGSVPPPVLARMVARGTITLIGPWSKTRAARTKIIGAWRRFFALAFI
jgi:hypothetical protein